MSSSSNDSNSIDRSRGKKPDFYYNCECETPLTIISFITLQVPYPKEGYHHPCQLPHRQVLPQTVLALRDNGFYQGIRYPDRSRKLSSPSSQLIDSNPNDEMMAFPYYSSLLIFSLLFSKCNAISKEK